MFLVGMRLRLPIGFDFKPCLLIVSLLERVIFYCYICHAVCRLSRPIASQGYGLEQPHSRAASGSLCLEDRLREIADTAITNAVKVRILFM